MADQAPRDLETAVNAYRTAQEAISQAAADEQAKRESETGLDLEAPPAAADDGA